MRIFKTMLVIGTLIATIIVIGGCGMVEDYNLKASGDKAVGKANKAMQQTLDATKANDEAVKKAQDLSNK